LSHPRVIFCINNGEFEIKIKRSDIVPFDEILNLNILNMPTNEIDINLDLTIPDHIRVEMHKIRV